MIESITITNHLGNTLELLMGNPRTSGFSVRRIEGLTPPKATVNLTEVLTDGGYFNSSRVGYRNIVLTLGFEAGYVDGVWMSIEDLRLKCYRFFAIKKELGIVIKTDNREVLVSGWVESNQPEIFSKDQTTSISIICPAAYFYDIDVNFVEFTYITGNFEFPFSNESTVAKLINMGEITMETERLIVYEGDSEVGILIRIHAFGSVEDLTIYNASTEEMMFINTSIIEDLTGDPIIAGDDIFISTIKGSKFIYLVRDGITYNVLNALQGTAKWFQLVNGDNLFNYDAVSGTGNITFSIEYNTLYEGV